MTICFLSRQCDTATVTYQDVGGPKAELALAGLPIPQTPWTIWKGKLTDLRPGTAYRYRIGYRVGEDKRQSESLVFSTLSGQAKTVSAALFNDLHSRPETLKALIALVRPEDYQFSVLMGDCWQDPSPADGAETVFKVLNEYVGLLKAGEKPMVYLRGNHDVRGGFAPTMAYLFDLLELDPQAALAEQAYQLAMTAGPVRLILLDTGEDFDKRAELFQPMRQRQAEWLARELRPERQAAWNVLLTHQPLYNNTIWYSEASRQLWEPVLAGAKIDLALAGHDHSGKLLEAGSQYEVTLEVEDANQHKGTAGTHVLAPPYPVLIGGGPGVKEATVMLLRADEKSLRVRLISGVDGAVLKELALDKGR